MLHNRRIFYFLGLIACNLVWALNPVVGKSLLASHSPLQVVWLRYLSSILTLLLVGALAARRVGPVLQRPRARQLGNLLVIALLTFWIGPCLQILGLSMSQATLNAIIIAMEPLMTMVVAWFAVGERVERAHVGFFGVSVAGFVLLSGLLKVGTTDAHTVDFRMVLGNCLMLVSLVGEACYSSFSRRLFVAAPGARAYTPLSAMATPLLIAVVMMSLVLWLPISGAGFPSDLSFSDGLGVLWLGPLATAGGYLFWNLALKHLSIASMVLTLFVQPLAGAFFGTAFLGERLDPPQVVGAAMIFASVVAQQVWEARKIPTEIKA